MAATKTTTFIKVTTPPMAIASNDITRDGSADAGMVEVISSFIPRVHNLQ